MNKRLTIRTSQTNVNRYLEKLMRLIVGKRIDLRFVITQRATLAHGPVLYETFLDKKDGCIKVVMSPRQMIAAA